MHHFEITTVNRFWFATLDEARQAHSKAASSLRSNESLSALTSAAAGDNGMRHPPVASAEIVPVEPVFEPAPSAMTRVPPSLEKSVKDFITFVTLKVQEHYEKKGQAKSAPTFYSDPPGQKMIRIVQQKGGVKSAFCFIDMATGDILKASRWGMAAKGARGNIYGADRGLEGVTIYGAKNLRHSSRTTRATPRPLLRKPEYVRQ